MKLIRDKIPEIIKTNKASSKYTITRCESSDEKYKYLLKKLWEEVDELLEDTCVEEMADVMEVVIAIGNHLGYSIEDIESCRLNKKQKRGGFEEGFLLEKK
jgi:predicted house-cleaning noncanonical NTP pyrophosphatase (MazG superfamily)